jgi:hypothetical protein
MHGRKALLGIIVGALVAALVATAIASQTVKVDSKVTMHGATRGQVKSSKHACEVQRKVKLFRRHFGHPHDQLIGTDTSNSRGEWDVEVALRPGLYYAKVLRRKGGTAGTIFVCRSDRSETFDLH